MDVDVETIAKNNLHREQIVPIYEKIFYYTRVCGILPFYFNAETSELTPVTSGFSYYLFNFNVGYLIVALFKIIFLLFYNWWTNFEHEDIPGGYFMQLGFFMGYTLLFAMLYVYTLFNKNIFMSTVASCIRLEDHILRGKIYLACI